MSISKGSIWRWFMAEAHCLLEQACSNLPLSFHCKLGRVYVTKRHISARHASFDPSNEPMVSSPIVKTLTLFQSDFQAHGSIVYPVSFLCTDLPNKPDTPSLLFLNAENLPSPCDMFGTSHAKITEPQNIMLGCCWSQAQLTPSPTAEAAPTSTATTAP